MSGGRVNLQKAAEIAIHDFRSGAWGRITLETPDEFVQWQAKAQAQEAERLARRRQRGKKARPQRDGPEPAADTGEGAP